MPVPAVVPVPMVPPVVVEEEPLCAEVELVETVLTPVDEPVVEELKVEPEPLVLVLVRPVADWLVAAASCTWA